MMAPLEISLKSIGVVDAAPEPEFDSITEFVSEFAKAPVALVSIVEPERDRQYFKAAYGLAEPWLSKRETPLSHSFCKYVQASGRPLIVRDSRVHDLVRDNGAVKDLNVVAYLGVPICGVNGAPVGALCAIDSKPREWTEEEIEKLTKLAGFVNDQIKLRTALKISEQQLDALAAEVEAHKVAKEELSRLASTDPLTGVLNRRAFMDRASIEIARLKRVEDDAAIVLADLDHFKRINDELGHDAGDHALRVVCRRLSMAMRAEIDIVARLGGEEFVLLLPSTDAVGALTAAERFRLTICDAPIVLPTGIQFSVSASFGTAQLRSACLDIETALKRADEALYLAKARGRNRVVRSIDCATDNSVDEVAVEG